MERVMVRTQDIAKAVDRKASQICAMARIMRVPKFGRDYFYTEEEAAAIIEYFRAIDSRRFERQKKRKES